MAITIPGSRTSIRLQEDDSDNENDDAVISLEDAFSDGDVESQPDEISEQIEIEEENLDQMRQDQKMYLGLHVNDEGFGLLLMSSTIHVHTFYKHMFGDIVRYLSDFNVMHYRTPSLELMKLHLIDDPTFGSIYSVTLKTHWLRLVQRRWKCVFRRRQDMIHSERHPVSKRILELRGCIHTYNTLPGLRGMMSDYANPKM
jgi:hypothetical protein